MSSDPLTDKQFNAQQRRVERLFDLWNDNLGLWQWHKTYHFFRGPIPDSKGGDGRTPCMQITPDFEYWQYKLEIDLDQCEDMTDKALGEAVIHELMHAILSELQIRPKHKLQEERICTWLAKAFWTVAYEPSRKMKKPTLHP